MKLKICNVAGKTKWRVCWRHRGKKLQRDFKTEEQAKSMMESLKAADQDWTSRLNFLPYPSKALLACILEDFDWSVNRLHAALVRADNLLSSKKLFSEVVTEFEVARRRLGVSDAYLTIVRNYVKDFERHLKPGTRLGDITRERISVWAGDASFSEMDRRRRLKALCTVYNFAIEMGYCQVNPVVEFLVQKRNESHGWVYILEANGRCKVGMTNHPNLMGRAKYYGTAHPGPVSIKALIKTQSPRKTERQVHKLFKSRGKHIKNEWFELTTDDFEMLAKEFGEAYVTGQIPGQEWGDHAVEDTATGPNVVSAASPPCGPAFHLP
jgi:hypothetical protein